MNHPALRLFSLLTPCGSHSVLTWERTSYLFKCSWQQTTSIQFTFEEDRRLQLSASEDCKLHRCVHSVMRQHGLYIVMKNELNSESLVQYVGCSEIHMLYDSLARGLN